MRRSTIIFISMAVAIISLASCAQNTAETVQKGKKVKLEYMIKIGERIIDSTQKTGPVEYIHGEPSGLNPILVSKLEGMRVGEEKNVILSPEEAYGNIDKNRFKVLPKDALPRDVELTKGRLIQLRTGNGGAINAIIWDITEDGNVVLNFNHPLAGQQLEYKVKIIGIE